MISQKVSDLAIAANPDIEPGTSPNTVIVSVSELHAAVVKDEEEAAEE